MAPPDLGTRILSPIGSSGVLRFFLFCMLALNTLWLGIHILRPLYAEHTANLSSSASIAAPVSAPLAPRTADDLALPNALAGAIMDRDLPLCEGAEGAEIGEIGEIAKGAEEMNVNLRMGGGGASFVERVAALYRKPSSCVKHCTERKAHVIKLPPGVKCNIGAPCIYTSQWPLHRDIAIYDRETITVKSICARNDEMICPPPTLLDCEEHGWSEWILKAHVYDFVYHTRFYNLQIQVERPFSIKSIFQADDPNYIQIVTFFTPNIIQPDKCNTLYCFYEYPSGEIERLQAKPGDMSFTFCPKPSRIDSIPTIRLSYDHEIFSEPYPYSIEPPARLGYVYLTLCANVKKEGKNLHEWIEFHLLMGYDRIVLYDNNGLETPDLLMERILKNYPDKVIRLPWLHRHAQTEACTDCILRYGPSTKWMSIFDVDEFMVPNSQHSNIRDILKAKYEKDPILHANWVTFGSCGQTAKKEGQLTIEQCRNLTRSFFVLPKSTFQPAHVAGVQVYGPHFPRLKADLGIRPRSKNVTVDADFVTFHYRFRSFEEFIERRKGDTAARIAKWTDGLLMKEWKKSLYFTKPMPDANNTILRFADAVKNRMKQNPVPWNV
eukprot:TRINITY_DN3858_c0_g1_i1.p1 TRINITY_DN3858_c0_g1~~TRINITY_DN3858_c0_g1_i1.p1  ORF type:complete len:607 (+),score=138.13 TRINITY_DN3858_c0_g1_i1:54-1874(+)